MEEMITNEFEVKTSKIPKELINELYKFCNAQSKCDECQHYILNKKCVILRILEIGFDAKVKGEIENETK